MALAGLVILFTPFVFAFSLRLGRYVIIDTSKKAISKPMIIKRKNVKFLSFTNFKWYEKIYNVHNVSSVIGLIIQPKEIKKIKYSNRKTPNCIQQILKLLVASSVPERKSPKRILG
ncbi:MAG: hypothetical protein ACFFCW_43090 [Candidatus Hodarchaeota archaeon]